jgi:hypothetical protein
MEPQRNKVCGIDVHKRFLIATILSRDGKKDTQRFRVTLEYLLKFRDWVIENGCEQVAIESTGIYWHPVHAVLEGKVDLIVANADSRMSDPCVAKYRAFRSGILHPYARLSLLRIILPLWLATSHSTLSRRL